MVGHVMDVGCGSGSIMHEVIAWRDARALIDTTTGIEIEPRLATVARKRFAGIAGTSIRVLDYLAPLPEDWPEPNLIIGNPPYSLAIEFVKRSLDLTRVQRGTVALLLRLNWLEGQARAQFHQEHPADVYVLPRRPSFTGSGTDATAYGWFVWRPGGGGRWSILAVEAAARKGGR